MHFLFKSEVETINFGFEFFSEGSSIPFFNLFYELECFITLSFH